ncbi:apoptosis regulatory protein Siva-like [Tribolium madens]|uniref:apoptosis regulatory protein Siva-like n=1 Tax=Tribolium madens TaxID=41895 RepID=UPI001CF741CA|nr:apoptosis regulatory protein Siva-like [Tribolium madens]
MPKRSCPDYDIIQPIKKQLNSISKSRKIRSSSSERTLQLLYQGASKREKNEETNSLCTVCSKEAPTDVMCNYCEHTLCLQCTNMCYKCSSGFCNNCSFPTYDQNISVCYSCS